MQSHSTLTVAIIVKDAAEALGETLASIADVADEIVVVDTGSADDGVRDTAVRYGARIINHPWQNDFSGARNCAMDAATCTWILWLDAGESVDHDDLAGLCDFVKFQARPERAYALLVQVPPNGDDEAGEQIARIRLVAGSAGLRYEGRVRENLGRSLGEHQIQLEGLHFRVQRSAREHLPQLKNDRARRNLRLAELEIKANGPTAPMLNCLGDGFQTLEDNRRAADCFRHAVSLANPGSPEMLEAYYGLLTSLGDESDKQLSLCVEALEIYPLDAQLLCSMGGYLQAQGRFDLALKSYQTAYEHGKVNPIVWHVTEVREIAAICLSLSLQIHDRVDEAHEVLEQAISGNETCQRLRRHLVEFCIKHNRAVAAVDHANYLTTTTPNPETLRTAVRGAVMASQENWIDAKAFLTTAYDAGCRDAICLRWLAVTLLATGELENAKPLLKEWQNVQPTNLEVARYIDALDAAGQDNTINVESPSADSQRLRVDPGLDRSPVAPLSATQSANRRTNQAPATD